MGWLLLCSVLILLTVTMRVVPREAEKGFWGTIIFLYLLGIINLNIGKFSFPMGILLGLIILNRKSRVNKSLKNLALFFALGYFILNLILPPMNFSDIWSYRERFRQINRFENVQAVYIVSNNAKEQAGLVELAPNKKGNMNLDDCIVMFRTWILEQEKVPIKSFDWLWAVANDTLKFRDSYHRVDDLTAEGYLNFEDGRNYFALFKKQVKDGPYHLSLIVEYSQIKPGQERKFPF